MDFVEVLYRYLFHAGAHLSTPQWIAVLAGATGAGYVFLLISGRR